MARADALAEARGLTRPAAIQVEYNLAAREVERDLVPMATAIGMGVLAWSPLGGGTLTGEQLNAATDGAGSDSQRPWAREPVQQVHDGGRPAGATEVRAVAAELGCTPRSWRSRGCALRPR